MSLDFVEINPPGEVKALVIWLHGLGDSGHGFAPIVPELKLDPSLGIRFIFPHAPVQPVTINGGMKMSSWYDIKSMDLESRADEAGVIESSALVEQIIEAQMAKGISSDKIILAGFSQGGVITLHLATRFNHQLAGIMALSTYMCAPQKLAEQKHHANDQTAIFMAHGRQDDVVPFQAGQSAKQTLESCGYQVSWQDYPMAHNVCIEQINAIGQWLTERLS